jgi:putative nucleotidyltransferase with HDIG domain
MPIPTRDEAARILRDLDPPDWLVAHSTAVADVAAFLAKSIQEQGHTINVPLVEAAALLHDIDKALPADHPLKPLRHADAGAQWLADNDYGELVGAVEAHPVMRLAEDDHYGPWSRGATVEERVVAYADKRATQDLVSMDERFNYWLERHGDTHEMRVARERADKLEAEVCSAAGIDPADVTRERWAEAAMSTGR